MDRQQLEHIIRASLNIAQIDELYILGSQSILGQYPDIEINVARNQNNIKIALNKESSLFIKMSMEADILVRNNYEKQFVLS